MKKVHSLCLALTLGVGLALPAGLATSHKQVREAKAEIPEGNLKIGGHELNSEDPAERVLNASTVMSETCTVTGSAELTYDEELNPILTLDNFSYVGVGYIPESGYVYSLYFNMYGKSLTVICKGNNKFQLTGQTSLTFGMSLRGSKIVLDHLMTLLPN